MDNLISIIVPVYNVEIYLSQCIESILNQSYRDFELILIDNMSTDASRSICDEYKNMDSRIVLLQNEKKGVSSTRNTGLNYARGNYIAFCDSDDVYSPLFLEKMIACIKENDADVAISNYVYLNRPNSSICDRLSGKIERNELIKGIFTDNTIGGFVWNKMFKKEILTSIRFDEKLSICEDTLFLCQALKEAERVYFEKDAVYLYRQRENSAISTIDNVIDKNGNIRYITVYDSIIANNLVSKEEETHILACEFVLATGVKCDYEIEHQTKITKNDIIYNNVRRTLSKTFWDFIKSLDYTPKKKIVVIGNCLFNLRKKKQTIYRCLANIKSALRHAIALCKRIEFVVQILGIGSSHVCLSDYDENKARNDLLMTCPFPNGSINATNNINAIVDLTVIVPAYNAEAYIEQCVNSIIRQKTKYKFEIIIVDDGSTDATHEIIQQYKAVNNVKIITQKNGGHSAARNSAVAVSSGRYLMFVDSDDYIMPDAIERLLDKAMRHNADLVEGAAFSFYDNGRISRFFKHSDSEKPVSAIDRFYGYPWGKVIRSTMFKHLQFPRGFWYEDTLFSMILYLQEKGAYTIADEVYAYRVNMKGITQSSKNNPRSIETLWITEYLLSEQKNRHLISEKSFNQFFDQMAMNDSRIRTLGEEIRTNVYVESVHLLKKYYGEYEFKIYKPKAKMLYYFIQHNDMRRAFDVMLYWNYIR